MKHLLIFLFSLLAVAGFAANPAYTDFRGTNEVLVTTNPSTGKIIIGPATPISTQINAAQVWTNDGTAVSLVGNGSTNTVTFSETDTVGSRANLTITADYTDQSAVGGTGIRVNLTGAATDNLFNQAIAGTTVVKGRIAGATYYGNSTAIGLFGSAGYYLGMGSTNAAVGVSGYGNGASGLTVGGVFEADSSVNGTTNVGCINNVLTEGDTGVFVAGYDEARIFANGNGTDDPIFENAIRLVDSRETGLPLIIARTNNGTFKAFQVNGDKTTNATPLDVLGVVSGYSGFGSYSTIATNAIGGTGYTNNQTINQTAYVTATAVAFTIKDRSGATLYVSPTLTATLPVNLQPGWAITAASGLTGTVLPF